MLAATLNAACGCAVAAADAPSPSASAVADPGDGRSTLQTLTHRFETLTTAHGWQTDTVYRYADEPDLRIRAWRSPREGEALWVIAGIHGEEPAGALAIAGRLASLVELAGSGVPVVLLPLCNPKGYRNHWRYPNTAERDWRKGGYSVGDAESLLPDLETGTGPRASAAPGPETAALTGYVLQLAATYPPRLVLDLHEDVLSTEGGYVYWQGQRADGAAVVAEVIRLLRASGFPFRDDGRTRFGEPIVDGVVSRVGRGQPIRDGSIDELLASPTVFVAGTRATGPDAPTVIVVETPAFAGSQLGRRVAAHGAVLERVRELWRLSPPRMP